jgi:segregation and condensation protein B
METLAIIAYKQPITATEISEIRSVDSGGVIHTLLERKLIKIAGRKEVVGKPMIYGTTTQFNVRFGLNSVDDLPDFDEFLHLIGSEADSTKLKIEFEDHFRSTEESDEPISGVNE